MYWRIAGATVVGAVKSHKDTEIEKLLEQMKQEEQAAHLGGFFMGKCTRGFRVGGTIV